MASSSSLPPPAPKILLSKPFSSTAPSPPAATATAAASLLLLLDPTTWDFHSDRALPFLTDNTDFTVVGVVGTVGSGKSTVLNHIYAFDPTSPSPGMLPPFAVQTGDTRASARHCTVGVEMRVSAERIILLDVQPVFCSSILVEMMKPDGSSAVPVFNGESLSADIAHETMGIQLAIFLSSICHILLVVSEGVDDTDMWHLMSTVHLLKHNIPDPSLLGSSHTQSSSAISDKDNGDSVVAADGEFLAEPFFVHTKLRHEDYPPSKVELLKKALSQYFGSSCNNMRKETIGSSEVPDSSAGPALHLLPVGPPDDSHQLQYNTFPTMLGKLRDEILSTNYRSFARTVTERDWVRNSAKIWEMVKNSSTVADYCRTLKTSGLFRR